MVAGWYAQDPPCDSVSAASSIEGFDGSVLAMVSWHAESDELARVVATGDIDRDTAPLLRAHLLEALAHRPVIRCDLRETDFFGAAGVDTLMEVRARAAEVGGTLILSGAATAVLDVLRATGVDGLFTVEP